MRIFAPDRASAISARNSSGVSQSARIMRIVIACLLMVVCSTAVTSAQDSAVKDPPRKQRKKRTPEERRAALEAAKLKRDKMKGEKKKRINEFADFMRVREDSRGRPVKMETSITRYIGKNDKGEEVSVDLIGVVHIGEEDYYKKLNEQFKQYDGMLYELVAPEGTVIPKGGREEGASGGMNPVAGLQKTMQAGLGLQFQLDHIDYTKKNFIHADMTPEEFAESMAKNNESVGRIFQKAIGQSFAQSAMGNSGTSDAEMLMALMSSNREIKLRRIMADQMQNMEGSMNVFEGDSGSTIIDFRNAKCMDVLKREMNSGKKKLAIFYGAGHLPDMQRRLQSDFKLKRGGQFWLEAWNLELKKKKKKKKAKE